VVEITKIFSFFFSFLPSMSEFLKIDMQLIYIYFSLSSEHSYLFSSGIRVGERFDALMTDEWKHVAHFLKPTSKSTYVTFSILCCVAAFASGGESYT
jgi:hypothetical protein